MNESEAQRNDPSQSLKRRKLDETESELHSSQTSFPMDDISQISFPLDAMDVETDNCEKESVPASDSASVSFLIPLVSFSPDDKARNLSFTGKPDRYKSTSQGLLGLENKQSQTQLYEQPSRTNFARRVRWA